MPKKSRPEIHSAKAHRCVDKVRAKGHSESSAWAICTASMGKDAVYAKGHGGRATPKRRTRESLMERLSFNDIYAEELAKLREANDCHLPAGRPDGGQFCSKGSRGSSYFRSDGSAKYDDPYEGAQQAKTPRPRPSRGQKRGPGWEFKVTATGDTIGTLSVNGKEYDVRTLPTYMTPYYYVPGFGSQNHFRTVAALAKYVKKRQAKPTPKWYTSSSEVD